MEYHEPSKKNHSGQGNAPVQQKKNTGGLYLKDHRQAFPLQLKKGLSLNTDAGLEKEADLMGSKALLNHQQNMPLQQKSINNNQEVIQPMLLYRFMNATDPKGYRPNSGVINKNISEIAPTPEALTLAAEKHKENIDAPDSPFISMTIDPRMAAEAGSIKTIVGKAPHVVPFNIPDKYVVPLTNKVSLREGEMLVWLPKGVSLAQFMVDEEPEYATAEQPKAIWENRYKDKSMEQIESMHEDEGFHGARLIPKGPRSFELHELNAKQGALWRQKRDADDRKDEKEKDKTAHVVKGKSGTIDLSQIVEVVKSLHHAGKKKDAIIAYLKQKYSFLPGHKIEALYRMGME